MLFKSMTANTGALLSGSKIELLLTRKPLQSVAVSSKRGVLQSQYKGKTMPTMIDAIQTFAACFAIAGAIVAALS
jgi:hypothetical protein